MKEKLQCTQCDIHWERVRARGRKPLFCPTCADLNAQEASQTPQKPRKDRVRTPQLEEKTTRTYKFFIPAPSVWTCDHCSTELKVLVGVTQIPEHLCSNRRNIGFPLTQKVREKTKTFTA